MGGNLWDQIVNYRQGDAGLRQGSLLWLFWPSLA